VRWMNFIVGLARDGAAWSVAHRAPRCTDTVKFLFRGDHVAYG
jgi:hypothetical protein